MLISHVKINNPNIAGGSSISGSNGRLKVESVESVRVVGILKESRVEKYKQTNKQTLANIINLRIGPSKGVSSIQSIE